MANPNPKKKHMANPNPKTEHLSKFPKIAPEGSAVKPVQVRIPKSQYDAWMKIPSQERNQYLREAIAKKIAESSVA